VADLAAAIRMAPAADLAAAMADAWEEPEAADTAAAADKSPHLSRFSV